MTEMVQFKNGKYGVRREVRGSFLGWSWHRYYEFHSAGARNCWWRDPEQVRGYCEIDTVDKAREVIETRISPAPEVPFDYGTPIADSAPQKLETPTLEEAGTTGSELGRERAQLAKSLRKTLKAKP